MHDQTNVDLRIEQLVLDGIDLPAHQSPLVQAAVEAELARLLAAEGLGAAWRAGGAVPRLSGGEIDLPADGDPSHLGQQIAQAVYGGLGE
jgi:hypothetical protein